MVSKNPTHGGSVHCCWASEAWVEAGSSIGERREAEESCLALEGLDGPAGADEDEAEEEEVVAMGEDADVAGAFPFRAAGIVGGWALCTSEDEQRP